MDVIARSDTMGAARQDPFQRLGELHRGFRIVDEGGHRTRQQTTEA